jgi:hypothetical protein
MSSKGWSLSHLEATDTAHIPSKAQGDLFYSPILEEDNTPYDAENSIEEGNTVQEDVGQETSH